MKRRFETISLGKTNALFCNSSEVPVRVRKKSHTMSQESKKARNPILKFSFTGWGNTVSQGIHLFLPANDPTTSQQLCLGSLAFNEETLVRQFSNQQHHFPVPQRFTSISYFMIHLVLPQESPKSYLSQHNSKVEEQSFLQVLNKLISELLKPSNVMYFWGAMWREVQLQHSTLKRKGKSEPNREIRDKTNCNQRCTVLESGHPNYLTYCLYNLLSKFTWFISSFGCTVRAFLDEYCMFLAPLLSLGLQWSFT